MTGWLLDTNILSELRRLHAANGMPSAASGLAYARRLHAKMFVVRKRVLKCELDVSL